MTDFPALMSLIVAARLAGVDPSALENARKPGPADETVVERVELSQIAAAQEAAFTQRASDGLAAAVTFDVDGNMLLKLRQDASRVLVPMAGLSQGRTVALARGVYRVGVSGGQLRAEGGPGGEQEPLGTVRDLVDLAHAKARQAVFPAQTYAVLVEEELGAAILLRKNQDDEYRVTHTSFERLSSRPFWFFALNWVGYAMRLEGRQLVFFKKPLTPPDVLARETVLTLPR